MTCQHTEFVEAVLQPLRPQLDSVDPGTLALHNRLQRPRADLPVNCNGLAVTLSFASAGAAADEPAYRLWLRGAELSGQVLVPRSLLATLLGSEALVAALDTLAPSAQAIVFEQALLPLLQPLEALLEQPLQIKVLSDATVTLPLSLRVGVTVADGPPLMLTLDLNLATAQRVAALLDERLPSLPQALPELPLSLALHAGWQTLTVSQAQSLRPGDVVMLEGPRDAELQLSLAASRWARARRHEQGIRLIEALNRVEPSMEYSMSQGTAEQGADASLGDVPLTLVCQVGTLHLSLADVQQLAQGSVLPLPEAGGDFVELLVNGRSVGRGELVRIGDGLGVRLTRFAAL